MASSRSASSRQTKSTKSTKSTNPTDVSPKAKRSSAYDGNFEQHLVDCSVYPEWHAYPTDRQTPEPGNMEEARLEFMAARASLSPSRFPESAFRDFKKKNNTNSEGTVMRNVIPIITGTASIPNEGNLPFTNFESLTDGLTVTPVPDFFDGAPLGNVDKSVREDLSQKIVPTKHADVPVAPNFFLEAKAPEGGAGVARRQACYDGAYGARAMHALQSYGEETPVYDGNAYTYSSTYHAGILRLYAHHVTAPTTPEGRPEYHMNKLRGFDLLDDRDTCADGIKHFRNARDLAQRHRDKFIQKANTRARQSDALAVDQPEAADAHQYGDSSSDEFVDCEEHVASQAVAAESYATSQDIDEGSALPQDLYGEDGGYSQESTSLDAVAPSMSFATSSTSNFSARSQTRSKRNRASHSPPANPQPHKKQDSAKSRTPHSAPRRPARSSTQASTFTTLAAEQPEVDWTWSDEHQLWYHRNEDGSCIWETAD